MSAIVSSGKQIAQQQTQQETAGPRIIVALDFDNADAAQSLVKRLDPQLCRLKIGKQLFASAGPALVDACQRDGFDVFLDLKFHDIPNTVAGACRAAAEMGVWMVNVHACGGPRMLEAARAAVPPHTNTRLIAVTVLTSMTAEDLAATGVTRSIESQVDHLARLTQEAGLDGVVCSPLEAKRLRALAGEPFDLVTPGVRPAGSDKGDQRRVTTPAAAIQAGSDYLVIGRPVTAALDPVAALVSIQAELDAI